MSSVPPDYRALSTFRAALRKFHRRTEEAARRVGMTSAQYQLLLAIKGFGDEHHHQPSVGDLAGLLQLRPNSVVELVDRASAADLVRRRADPRDARRQRLVLTDNGEAKLERLSHLQSDELTRFRREVAPLLATLD